jgi:hypothetical protein
MVPHSSAKRGSSDAGNISVSARALVLDQHTSIESNEVWEVTPAAAGTAGPQFQFVIALF